MPSSRSEKHPFDVAVRYCLDIVEGEILACELTKLACQRQLDDLEHGHKRGLVFDPDAAKRIVDFFKIVPHVKGRRWAGRTIALEPWQQFNLTTVFGWKLEEDGSRRFRTVYNEVAKKNTKTTISAGVGLYMLSADGEPGAEVYSAAVKYDQAAITFNIAKAMVKKSPELRKRIGVLARNLHVEATLSMMEALCSEYSGIEGINPHCAIVDELHAHKTSLVYDVIDSATGARDQPLIWIITTAGFNLGGVCFQVRSYLVKILKGILEDDSFFGVIYTLDDGDDCFDPALWLKANPNLGISPSLRDLEDQARKARATPSLLVSYQTKRCNMWVNAGTAWLDIVDWNACGEEEIKLEDFEGEACWLGVDLASKIDIAALVLVFRRGGKYYIFVRCYLPEEVVKKGAHANHAHYFGWAKQGLLTLTPGNAIDIGRIRTDILGDDDDPQAPPGYASRFEIREVAHDPWQAAQLAGELAAAGATPVEIRPTVQNFSPVMKEIEGLVADRQLEHGGNRMMNWMISNVVCHTDKKDNIYPRKETPNNKIDGVIAMLMALNRAMVGGGVPKKSVYEQRGVRTI